MRLRLILLVLSLLAFLSASTGGYLYYSSLKEAAFNDAKRQSIARLEMIRRNLSFLLSENIRTVKTLSGLNQLSQALADSSGLRLEKANRTLDHFKDTLNVDVCYLMDREANTIASSNRHETDSFVGQNFYFRPYYKQAIQGDPFVYMALGTTSGKRGAYSSHPVFHENHKNPMGVAVIKASIGMIEKELDIAADEIILVTDHHGIIFISNREDWLYKLVWKKSNDEIKEIFDSKQFGTGPWPWSGLTQSEDQMMDQSGNVYMLHQRKLDHFPKWTVIHLRNLNTVSQTVIEPLKRITGPIVFTLCILIGFSVFFLYRKASLEILQRKSVEKALRKSEERYRSLYHHTPAMLHSIDPDGGLVSVSDYWTEVLGYQRDEVIGKKLTNFLTDESKSYAEKIVFPEFFNNGYCNDVAYQFIKKNGEIIDVLLSAIADRDENGLIMRSLAVSIDVTERKKAEEALKHAKEELSDYSKTLEKKVARRTREITSILKYTPAVIYIKDDKGKFTLVNSRYEELFGVRNEDVRGKTDYEFLPKEVADQFRQNDIKVLNEKRPCQMEEKIPQEDGIHTYLSIKFPVYEESGDVSGVCGILSDITAVKKAQDRLRRLSGSIMENQEKERSALARELHDELGQSLTALRMDAVWIQERLREIKPETGERALSMCHLIDKTIKEVRNMAFHLRPGVLDDLGLVDALELYTADFEKRTEITCVFEYGKIPQVNDTVATASYRIVQEALTNVARHSFADRVDVILNLDEGILSLNIIDNGRGFNVLELTESEGLGVAGMRERAGLAGGMLDVQSTMGIGFKVCFQVPIH